MLWKINCSPEYGEHFNQGRTSWDKKELFETRRRAFIWESILTHTERPPAVLPGTNKLRCTQATMNKFMAVHQEFCWTQRKNCFVLPWRSVKVKFTVRHTAWLALVVLAQINMKMYHFLFVVTSCQYSVSSLWIFNGAMGSCLDFIEWMLSK